MNKEQFIALGLTEEQAKKAAEASTEELKSYVEKQKFDTVSEENKNLKTTVKENATQLENLKKSAGDNEELKNQIATLQADNATKEQEYQGQLKDLQLSNAIKLSIAGKVQDEGIVSGLIDKSKLILGDDGKVTGLDEQLKGLQESKAFLFKQEDTTNTTIPGFKLGADGSGSGGAANINTQLDAIFGNETK
ncbi:phage scaffolding protein [Clostridium pasteurianum]|uniref:Phage minor structural protein GP20 n=1 Tax=Clostridium pasteurianum BC1 TaxID=86416 RepID=R4K521_CLOPA|nr:phage scaffolding protein [Clostridium pasteurianum]AGK95624.1 Phage minor structural protein GP20 [Clostridium pasteurianum BC1]